MKDIAGRRPINKTAALVVSKGFEYSPAKVVLTRDQGSPIKTRALPLDAEALTGKRFGRFTVIGLAKDTNSRWVVRCDCGTYTLRTAKAVKNKENTQDRCEHCRHLAHLKRGDYNRRTGKDINIREF